jgi:hypothetical protein
MRSGCFFSGNLENNLPDRDEALLCLEAVMISLGSVFSASISYQARLNG